MNGASVANTLAFVGAADVTPTKKRKKNGTNHEVYSPLAESHPAKSIIHP